MKNILLSFAMIGLFSFSIIAQTEVHQFDKVDGSDARLADLEQAASDYPEDEIANYELARYYYNQGVTIIESMDYDADFEKKYSIQASVMEAFNKALPFANKAHEINPNRREVLQMLAGIHFGLNNIEESKRFEKLLEELE